MRRAGLALALCGAVVALDQATKAIVRSSLTPGETIDLALGVELANVHNTGAAFGLFAGDHAPLVVALSLGAMLLLTVFLVRYASQSGIWIAAALIAGGALGNLADRVRLGYVSDFIDPPAWPAFNVADMAIVAGVGLILLKVTREHA